MTKIERAPGPLFFGCWGATGHYLRDVNRQHISCQGLPFTTKELDSKFLPPVYQYEPNPEQPEGEGWLSYASGLSFLDFWDRSVDNRKGSHALFIIPAEMPLEGVIEAARDFFPDIWSRFTFEVRLRPDCRALKTWAEHGTRVNA